MPADRREASLDYVRVERGDGVSVLTIDRQEKLNALDPQVVEEIGQALLELEAEGPRAIVVTGAGERSFVAGADISAMSEMDPLEAKRFSEIGHAAMALLDRSPVPTIAAVKDRKSTRLNSSHANISYAVFCLKK